MTKKSYATNHTWEAWRTDGGGDMAMYGSERGKSKELEGHQAGL